MFAKEYCLQVQFNRQINTNKFVECILNEEFINKRIKLIFNLYEKSYSENTEFIILLYKLLLKLFKQFRCSRNNFIILK